MVVSNFKDFTRVVKEVYYGYGGGVMAQALSMAKAKMELQRVHKLSCGDKDVSLYRRLQRQRHYWPKMAKAVAKQQSVCPQCQEPLDTRESLFMQSVGDWK